MKKLLAILLLCIPAFGTTTFTGHIGTLGTTSVTTGSFVRFWLRGCGGNQPRVGGLTVIAPSQGAVFFFDFKANSSGDVSGTLYSNRDVTGLTDGEIECGGSHTSTWYGMQIFYAGKGGPEIPILAKNSDTFDVSNITPLTTAPVVTAPNGDSTYARIDAGNQPFTGSVTPSGNGILNLGGSSNRWNGFFNTLNASGATTLSGTTTLSGASTFSGANTFSGVSTFSAASTFNALATFNSGWSGVSAGVFTNTANTENGIFGTKLNSCNPSTEWAGTQGGTADTAGLFGCVKAPNTSTVHQVSGVAGYATGANATTNVVGGFFSGRAQANSVNAWGSNSIVTDAGFNSTFLVGHEIDVNITGTPGTVWGLEMSGLQTVAPDTSGVDAGGRTAFILAGQNAPGWNTGFYCGQGVLKVTNQYANGGACILLGSASSGNSQNSQGIVAFSTNSGGTHPYAYLLEDAVGTFEIANSPMQINHRLAFSTLGTCNSAAEGTMSPVTDSTTATWGATITGSGANHVLAYCNGTNWTVAAK